MLTLVMSTREDALRTSMVLNAAVTFVVLGIRIDVLESRKSTALVADPKSRSPCQRYPLSMACNRPQRADDASFRAAAPANVAYPSAVEPNSIFSSPRP
jgi:hypothetical protein